MRARLMKLLVLTAWLPLAATAQNLIVNGSFDAPGDPLKGWNYDYAWTGNSHYLGNASHVSVVAEAGGQRQAVQLRSPGDAGVKFESQLIPFEQGAKYRATLKVKGGPYRIYFSGYQWKPGIRPHSDPKLEDMRAAYRSKAEAGQASSWKTVTLEIPGADASDLSRKHLGNVRMITLYLWFLGSGFVDDVTITKVSASGR